MGIAHLTLYFYCFIVFCIDYDDELDLVVSGSSDCTIKLWQMSTGTCLATKVGHENWITSVSMQHNIS